MRTRVKICGLTRESDVRAATDVGADAVGFVFHASSPRAVEIDQARVLADCVPPFVARVGLFVNADSARVREVLNRVPLEVLQFHGEEPSAYCASFGRSWIKALRVRPGIDLQSLAKRYTAASGLLLDAYDPSLPGGTGRRFDWDLIPAELRPSIVLAGGLDADNVAEAIRCVRPYAVDVSGGVEAARGIKDRRKMAEFLKGVSDGDESR